MSCVCVSVCLCVCVIFDYFYVLNHLKRSTIYFLIIFGVSRVKGLVEVMMSTVCLCPI